MTNNTDINAPAQYKSLSEIRIRKDQILKSIRKDDESMRRLWNSMFNKPATLTSKLPSKRISGLMNRGLASSTACCWPGNCIENSRKEDNFFSETKL